LGVAAWAWGLSGGVSAAVVRDVRSASFADAPKREWRKIEVPGAVCGDGRQYSIFVSPGDPGKIVFDLMGGGACWSATTCYALPDTWIHPLPMVLESGGALSTDPARSPLADHTVVYFPYCTADVFVGHHIAHYIPGVDFHHAGAEDFSAALALVVGEGIVDLAHARQFTLMGYSAGAIGALFHAFTLEPYVRDVPDKVLIADAPGLHFGPKFWDKFTPELLAEFGEGMERVGMRLDPHDGNIAALVPRVCGLLPDWRVGVLQGARDLVMSRGFGSISRDDFERLVYGPSGVFGMTALDAEDNCSAWTPATAMHTFLVTDRSAGIRASGGTSAMDYVRGVVQGAWRSGAHPGSAGPSFR
jgi:hypothetical protein